MKFKFLAAALTAFLALPALALAAPGFATANVNMRSGPGTAYPAVVVIPVGTQVEIHGCLAAEAWCDVSFFGGRGWVSGRYIQGVYNRSRVYVDRNYYQRLGIPTIVFDLDTYWGRHYRNRDFYRSRDEWRRGPDRRPPPSWNDSRPRPDLDRPRPPRPDRDWNDNRPQRPRPDQARPDRPRPDQVRPDRPRPDQARPDRPRPDQARPERPRPDQARPERPRPDQARPERPQPPREQVRPRPERRDQCLPGQICSRGDR